MTEQDEQNIILVEHYYSPNGEHMFRISIGGTECFPMTYRDKLPRQIVEELCKDYNFPVVLRIGRDIPPEIMPNLQEEYYGLINPQDIDKDTGV